MKSIATDTYNFEGLITDRRTYVDKTEVLYPLINKSIGRNRGGDGGRRDEEW
jgi:hypothetical protein